MSASGVPLKENTQRMQTEGCNNVHTEVIEGGVHGISDLSFPREIIDPAFAEHPTSPFENETDSQI